MWSGCADAMIGCWYFVSTCLPSFARAGWGERRSGSRGLVPDGSLRTPAAIALDFGMAIGRVETTSTRAVKSHTTQRNASQISRTQSAGVLIRATHITIIKYHTNHTPSHRKHDRTGQSTTSTTSNASRLPKPQTKPSSSRNGPPKLSPVAITTLTCARDNGRACSIADYPPCRKSTSDIWHAMMVANRQLAVDLEWRRHRRIADIQGDPTKDR